MSFEPGSDLIDVAHQLCPQRPPLVSVLRYGLAIILSCPLKKAMASDAKFKSLPFKIKVVIILPRHRDIRNNVIVVPPTRNFPDILSQSPSNFIEKEPDGLRCL